MLDCREMKEETIVKINKAIRVLSLLCAVVLAACLAYGVRYILKGNH